MNVRLERNPLRKALLGLLASGFLLVGGATAAGADDGYGSDGSDCAECPPPPPVTTPEPPHYGPPPTVPHAPHYGPTYPVPATPSHPAPPQDVAAPPVLPRTGSDTGLLVAGGAGALAIGGGLVLLARRRKLALSPN